MLAETEYIARTYSSPLFSGDADLLLIREDLAEEWGAVIGYLECSNEVKDRLISKQFYDAAQDEIGHVIRLMRTLAVLDQVQAEALRKSGLFWLSGFEHQPAIPPLKPKETSRVETDDNLRLGNHGSKKYFEPDEKTMECLRNAIRDELQAINVYQRQLASTDNQIIQNILVSIMNQKKEHVAGFTASLHNLLRECGLPVGSII